MIAEQRVLRSALASAQDYWKIQLFEEGGTRIIFAIGARKLASEGVYEFKLRSGGRVMWMRKFTPEEIEEEMAAVTQEPGAEFMPEYLFQYRGQNGKVCEGWPGPRQIAGPLLGLMAPSTLESVRQWR